MKKSKLVRALTLVGSLVLQLSTLCFHSRGAAGDVDLSFDPGSGVNGTVHAVAVQSDGKVIIGGEFSMVKGLHRFKVARLNADGSGDASFNPSTAAGFDGLGVVSAIALQPDGKVIVVGSFDTVVNGTNMHRVVARLNANGSLDNTFNTGAGLYNNGYALCVALQSDGKVLIGGQIHTTNEFHGIARLNANGSVDGSFNPNLDFASIVYSLAVQPDGKVLIGERGEPIYRLNTNGSFDGSFNPGSGANDVLSIALQPDGRMLIGGEFVTVNGTNRNRIARLDSNGSLDASFNPGLGVTNYPPFYCAVRSIALQSDGRMIIGGSFSSVNGTNRNGIARINANGGLDTSFNPGAGANTSVRSVAIQPDGKGVVGGEFTTMDGVVRSRIARLNADGTLDGIFQPGAGVDSPVAALVVQSDGKALIGGGFTTVRNLARSRIARLNVDGSGDSTFDPSTIANGPVSCLALHAGNKMIFAAGYDRYTDPYYYQDYQVTGLNSDGTLDAGFFLPRQHPYGGTVNSLAVQSDGGVMVGGTILVEISDGAGGGTLFPQPRITRLYGNENFSFSYNPDYGGSISTVVVQPDNKVFIAGSWFVGTTGYGSARLNSDGSPDNSFNTTAGGLVLVQPEGKLLFSGTIRVNPDGSPDNSFNTGTGPNGGVRSMALQPDGKVLVAGDFTAFNGTNRNGIARLNVNGSLDNSFNAGSGANGIVRTIALQPDGNILISGDFTTINGVMLPHVARLYGDSPWPSLKIARSNALMILSWPVTALNFQLRETTNLALPNSWSPVAQPAVTNGAQISVTVPAEVGAKFFRLKSQ